MIKTVGDTRTAGGDASIDYRVNGEVAAIEAQRQKTGVITSFAVVFMIDDQEVELVTRCDLQGRVNWREELGIKLHEFDPRLGATLAEDIDANWGMAWQKDDGSIHHAGPNLGYARRAMRNIEQYRFDRSGLRVTLENTDDHSSPFALVGTVAEGLGYQDVDERVDLTLPERPFALDIYGILPTGTDPWGMAWKPVTLPPAKKGEKTAAEPVVHSVIIVTGNDPSYCHQAVRRLALRN